MARFARVCKEYGISVRSQVKYNGQVYTVSRIVYETPTSTNPTLELVNPQLGRGKSLEVPADRVTKILNEGSSSRTSSMLYS